MKPLTRNNINIHSNGVPRIILPLSFLLATCTALSAHAAEVTPSESAGALAAIFGAGLVFIAIVFISYLVFLAIFIHMSAGLMNLPKHSFGTACVAALINFLLSIFIPSAVIFVGGSILASLGIESQVLLFGIALAALLIPGTLAIKISYGAELFSSLITYVISLVLTLIGIILCVIGLTMVLPS